MSAKIEFIDKIKKVMQANILSKDLSDIPKNGATLNMIKEEEQSLPRPLSEQHIAFLKEWNGANLDFLRVLGVHPVENEFLEELAKENKEWEDIVTEVGHGAIYFANDISGFMYFELSDGTITQYDTDGSNDEKLATDMNDFFDNYIFGARAAEYAEQEWLEELKEAGVI